MQKLIAVSAVALGLYLYQSKNKATAPDTEATTEGGDNPCPEGYRVNDAGTACTALNPCDEGYVLGTDGKCKLIGSPCNAGYKLSADGKTCEFDGNPCGDDCMTYDKETKSCKPIPNCGTKTGSEAGDLALNIGVGVVSGAVMDMALTKAVEAGERRVAEKAGLEVAEKAGEKAGLEVAEKAGVKAGEKAGLETAEKIAMTEARELLAKRTTQVVAKQSAKEIATIMGRKLAVKIAQMGAKMTSASSTGIGAILAPFTAMAIANAVALASTGTYFEKDSPDDKAWDDVDETARAFFEAIPFWGDMMSILGSYIAFKSGCPTGTQNENGLCYAPPHPDFHCEAFLCYANASAYPKPMPMSAGGDSLAFMTKGVRTEPGDIPNICPPGMEHGEGGAFCYEKPAWAGKILLGMAHETCPPGFDDTGTRCEKIYNVRSAPATLKGCYDYQVAEGWLRSRDDGTSCWEDLNTSGGGCHRECHGDPWKALWESGHEECNSWCDPIITNGCGCIKKWGHERAKICPAGMEFVETMCYETCAPGFHHQPGMPYICSASYNKHTAEVLAPHGNLCPDDKFDNGGGLCYVKDDHMPAGYFRRTFGLLEPRAPDDKPEWRNLENFNPTSDSPLSVKKATYTRKPYPIFSIYLMKPHKNEEPEPEPLPPLCSALEDAKPDQEKKLCREDTPADKQITDDGLNFFKKCREGYEFLVASKKCSKVSEDGETKDQYDNSDGFVEVKYHKK